MENHGTPIELTDEQLAAVFGGQEEIVRDEACAESAMESEFAL